MKHQTRVSVAVVMAFVMLALLMLAVTPALANPPAPDVPAVQNASELPPAGGTNYAKNMDWPNRTDYLRMMERQRLLAAGDTALASSLALSGTDRILAVMVEYAGTDVFTWTAGTSTWDPIGQADPSENVYDADGNLLPGVCTGIYTKVAEMKNTPITTGTKVQFTYGPLSFNQIPRPLSAADRSGDTIWTPNFNQQWYHDMLFGDGVTFSYTRTDNSVVNEDFTGSSVTDYYLDLSNGQYQIDGDIIKVTVPHSPWWYGADDCPGARSAGTSSLADGSIPLAGSPRTLVKDALDALNAISNTIPGFDWANYDGNDDGIIDRLWIIHAGYGEEDGTDLLNRTAYGESAVWSHSSAVTPPYSVTEDIAAGAYIVMPENGGIGVFAHEYAHNLGAWDLYAYGAGETSAGFWALQADDWTGYPIGFEPPAPDAMHLDMWGWLDPMVITDTSKVYEFTVGQASRFNNIPNNDNIYRAGKIVLPEGELGLASPIWAGDVYWWGGKGDEMNSMMTTKAPIAVAAGNNLTFDLAYDIEEQWDFLWVQVSTDTTTWDTLTNTNTICTHDESWIGGLYGFPEDLCAAGIGGLTGQNADFPDHETQTFDMSAYAGQSVYLRFWYMTDWGSTGFGPFVDNVVLGSFSDGAETGDGNWTYAAPWSSSNGTQKFSHNLYLQWRNTSATGGYDSALGDSRWRFGPANTGLLVWYNNQFYSDNEIYNYLDDANAYGPKGNTLVIDAHPTPYRDPNRTASSLGHANTNVTSRMQMRDATFSLVDSVDFTVKPPYVISATNFEGRPAVSMFSDAYGYYPGFAMESTRGFWNTVSWDASAVVPAKGPYSTKAADGFPGWGVLYREDAGGWYYANGPDVLGGTGNPGDSGVQYGWNVEIVKQTDMTATLRVYNQLVTFTPSYTPKAILLENPGTYRITYTMVVKNEGTTDVHDVKVVYDVDKDLTVISMTKDENGTVDFPNDTVWWTDVMTPGEVVTITLVAEGRVGTEDGTLGTFNLPVIHNTVVSALANATNFGPWEQPTTVNVLRYIYLPLVMKNYAPAN